MKEITLDLLNNGQDFIDPALDPIFINETRNIKLFNATFFIWN